MADILFLNGKLKEVYGLTIDGRNRFRIVWSENCFEKRMNPFGKIEELKKYSYLDKRYIFEVYTPEAKANPEILSDGYEPFYVFQDKHGKYLEPVWWACEVAVKLWIQAKNVAEHRLTAQQMESIEKEKEAKEVETFKDSLEVSSLDQMKFRYGEAVIHDSSKALTEETK
jgi:hypothetical protein